VVLTTTGAFDALGAPLVENDIVAIDRDGEAFLQGNPGVDLSFAADIFNGQLYAATTPHLTARWINCSQ